MVAAFDIPLSWAELLKRTAKETSEDDCLGLADPGEKVPGQKKKIGAAAARAYQERREHRPSKPAAIPAVSRPAAFQSTPSPTDRKLGIAMGLSLLATRVWNRFRRRRGEHA
jgi:hypothetical protein